MSEYVTETQREGSLTLNLKAFVAFSSFPLLFCIYCFDSAPQSNPSTALPAHYSDSPITNWILLLVIRRAASNTPTCLTSRTVRTSTPNPQILPMLSHHLANPFAKRDSHAVKAVWTYKVLTILTWLLNVIVCLYYTFGMPSDDKKAWRNSIWGHNKAFETPFALNALIASLYWYAEKAHPHRFITDSP